MSKTLVLTYEYLDKSGFYVCGVTDSYTAAMAWYRAGDGHKVYALDLNQIAEYDVGFAPWLASSPSTPGSEKGE